MDEAKRKKIDEFVGVTNKNIGPNTVIFGNAARQKVDTITTGSLKIDAATGIGGIPKGRIIELWGSESSGKSTMCLQTAANCQKIGGAVLYIDAENALDPTYAKALGVVLEDITFAQPETAEESLTIAKNGLESGVFDLIVIDSIAALVPRAVLEGDIGDAHVGVLARLMSANLPKLARAASVSNTALVLINQTRSKIGITYGDPTTTSGGNALKFYASMRIQMTRSTLRKDGEEVLGNTVKVKVVKNKLAAPFTECEPEIIYGEGFSLERELVDIGAANDIIEKSGSWYIIYGERVQGKDNAVQYLMSKPDIMDKLNKEVRASVLV